MSQDIVVEETGHTTCSSVRAAARILLFIATLLVVHMACTAAWSQTPSTGPYVLTTYDVEELASRPATIQVGTRVQAHIEFDDVIEEVSSARQDWFTIEVKQHRVSMRADQSVGRTDLLVVVGGRLVMFTVEIDDTLNVPRRYVVGEVRRPSPRVSSTAGRQVAPLPDADPAAAVVTPAERPLPGDPVLPEWLVFTAEATRAPSGALAISYALANEGEHPLATDAARLRVEFLDPIAGPQPVPFTLSRVSADGRRNRLAAGGVEFGTILIEDVPEGPVSLLWPVVQIGPALHYTLLRTFHDGFVRPLR